MSELTGPATGQPRADEPPAAAPSAAAAAPIVQNPPPGADIPAAGDDPAAATAPAAGDTAGAGDTGDAPAGADRLRAAAWYAVPLAIFAATRVAQVAVIAWMLPADDRGGVRGRLLAWDSGWFIRVAREGYPAGYTYDEAGHVAGNGLAFFPGFPTLVRAVHLLTGAGFEDAALAAGTIAGALAAMAVYALGVSLYDRRVGAALAALFCAQPMSVVLSMGYSEGLFVAFAATALVAARRNAWTLAAVAGLGAALTRPTGTALALAVALAAVMRIWSTPPGTPRRWQPALAAAVALAGVPGYLAWVGLHAGSWRAWFDIQTAGWGTTFDSGRSVGRFIAESLRTGDGWVAVSVAWLLIAAAVLAVAAVLQRVWPPLLGYGLLSLVLVFGQAGFYHSKPRLLVTVLLVLVPLAVALGRARTRTAVVALVGYSAFGLWFGSYLLTVWHFAI